MIARRVDPGLPSTRLYTFQIVIEQETEGGDYTAYSPTLPGCFRRATTVDEARERVRQAVHERLESLRARGEPVSQGRNERRIHVEELSISVPDGRRPPA